jgi:PPOX class probable F420-dependent enzyme
MAKLTEAQAEFLREGHLAIVATVRPDGTPQLTPTWVDSDGKHVLVNTAEGRVKPRNLRRNPNIAVAVIDRDNPYRWLAVTGTAELEHEGAEEHIDALAHRYTGRESYGVAPDEQRVIVRVTPRQITARGVD